MPAKRVVAFWLIPAPPEKQLLSAYIRILARAFEAPLFEPHVTLCTSSMAPAEAGKILQRMSRAPLQLTIEGLDWSGKFTKTLFVRFRKDPRLTAFSSEVMWATRLKVVEADDPHLSLCYQRLPASTKREIAASLILPFKRVRFNVVKAVQCLAPTTNASDVKDWRILGSRRLNG